MREKPLALKTRSAASTRAVGRRLARLLRGGDVVCLDGELGSGKTTFCQGLAAGLGCRDRVASPTFVLVRVYRGTRWTAYHVDCYRLSGGEARDIGLEDCLADPKGICAIEWPAAVERQLPEDRLEASFSYGSRPEERRIALRGLGPRSRAVVERLRTRVS